MKQLISLRPLALAAATALFISGCGSDDSTGPEPPEPPYTEADSTLILPPEEEAVILDYNPDGGDLTLDESSDYAEDVEVGSILIGQDDETAPDGFLLRVTSVSSQRGTLVLGTEPTLLTDAFEQMALSDSFQLRPSQIRTSRLFNGAKTIPDRDDETFSVGLDCLLYDQDGNENTTTDQIRLDGTYSFTARLFAEIDIDWFTLEKLEVGVVTDQTVDLDLIASVGWEFISEQEIDLWQIGLGAIPLGGAVWIVPMLEVEAHIHGDLSVSIETSINFTQEIRNGIGYERQADPQFYTISHSEKHFNYTPPQFTAELDFEAGASLNAACLLYGVAGPFMGGKTGLHFNAALSGDPCDQDLTLDLDAILYAVVGLEMDVWVFDLEWREEFEIYTYPIGDWNWPLSGSGTVIIDVEPDELNASWTLVGPCDYNETGSGDETLTDMPVGSYTITWGAVDGYITPGGDTQTLAADGTITFTGIYVEGTGPTEGFTLIPAGTFTMGAPSDEPGTQSDERPQHNVTLTHSFYLHVTEITNQQYADLAQWAYNYGYATATSGSLRDALDGSTQELLDMDDSDCEISFSGSVFTVDAGRENHPVKEVTWYGSAAYCDWLSLYEGLPRAYDHNSWQCNGNSPYTAQGYRLPTEAEWEYACRAGTQTPFNTGDCLDAGTEANYNGNYPYTGCSSGPYEGWTVPVGSYPTNAWGLYDMHGNLWEWCNDWYSSGYYSDPGSGYDPVGGPPGARRVIRGGYWYYDARYCRSASRYSYGYPYYSYYSIGFRAVRSAF